jgi:ADP-ribose pyrophosphatase YjhB (NUDIX family)
MDDRNAEPDLLELLDKVQSIGRNGLAYATDPFDRERYQRLVEIASTWYARLVEVPAERIREKWARELGQVTPKVGAEAAVFDREGRLLVVRRADDGCWGLPGGWLEPNETPAEAARRETREETGLEVRIDRLVDVFTRKARQGQAPQASVAILYLCDPVSGDLRLSHESTDVAFMPLEAVPAWHGWHEEHAAAAFRLWRATRSE